MHIVMCISILAFSLFTYWIIGAAVSMHLKTDGSPVFCMLSGCFIYFALFNVVYLPLFLFRANLMILLYVWMFVWGTMVISSFYLVFLNGSAQHLNLQFDKSQAPQILIFMALVAVLFYFTVRVGYYGWDTAYYIKEISRAQIHGTMYLNWNPNVSDRAIGLRYGLCAYNMHLALFAKMTGSPAILVARIIGGGACTILSVAAVYLLFAEVFNDRNDRLTAATVWIVLNFLYVSIYTASAFLMERNYEGKAWCGNVIIPFLILLFYRMDKEKNALSYWLYVGVVALSCNSISMSSLVIVPVLISMMTGILFFKNRNILILKKWMVCMLPPTAYCLAFVLYSKGLLKILG